MIEVNLKLFGALREYDVDGAGYTLHLSKPLAVKELKDAFMQQVKMHHPHFKQYQLIQDSALANESHVLSLHQSVNSSCTLFVLPPVCGG